MILVTIYYHGDIRKRRMFSMDEEYTVFMKYYYGIDTAKDLKYVKKSDGTEIRYFVPKEKMYGKDSDDSGLEIKEIIVEEEEMP